MSGSVSQATSRRIFDDAQAAHEDPGHPCHRFVALQAGVAADHWQLPVPFMGRSANRGIVFLGFNPSWDPNEVSPRWGCSFADFDSYSRSVFASPSTSWPRLYRWYQAIGERALAGFRLGEDALVLEVVRYRSAVSAGCNLPTVLDHELPMTAELLGELAPAAIFCCGSAVLWHLRTMLHDLQVRIPADYRIRSIEGRVYRVTAPWGATAVVPSRHLTGAFGWSNDARLALGNSLRNALEPGDSSADIGR